MHWGGDKGIGITNELVRLDETSGFDDWLAGDARMLAEHNGEPSGSGARPDGAFGGEVFVLRGCVPPGKVKLSVRMVFITCEDCEVF